MRSRVRASWHVSGLEGVAGVCALSFLFPNTNPLIKKITVVYGKCGSVPLKQAHTCS